MLVIRYFCYSRYFQLFQHLNAIELNLTKIFLTITANNASDNNFYFERMECDQLHGYVFLYTDCGISEKKFIFGPRCNARIAYFIIKCVDIKRRKMRQLFHRIVNTSIKRVFLFYFFSFLFCLLYFLMYLMVLTIDRTYNFQFNFFVLLLPN